jgi:formylglycine-generating enzyme
MRQNGTIRKTGTIRILVCVLLVSATLLPLGGCKGKKEVDREGKPGPAGPGAKGKKQTSQKKINCPDGMAYVPDGAFNMGCSDADNLCRPDETRREVKISKGYCVDTHEVTQGDYAQAMGMNPSFFKQCGATCPVEQVDWNQANAYCIKTGKRLPTEAEWEYAARGGSTLRYYWGGAANGDSAWYADNGAQSPHPVGSKQPNAFGLYDMLGNVWEWVNTVYGEYPSKPLTDPKGPASGPMRVLRGGGFSNSDALLRVSYRDKAKPEVKNKFIGFRCVKGVK